MASNGAPGFARLRSAWLLARAGLPKAMEGISTAQAPTSSADLDDPLGEAAEPRRTETFKQAYDGLIFEGDYAFGPAHREAVP